MRLGFHLSIAGSLLRAVYEAQVLGCQALQIFVQNPRGWKWRPVAPAAIEDFFQARAWAGLSPLVVHLGYLPNLRHPIRLFMPCQPRGYPGNLEWPGT